MAAGCFKGSPNQGVKDYAGPIGFDGPSTVNITDRIVGRDSISRSISYRLIRHFDRSSCGARESWQGPTAERKLPSPKSVMCFAGFDSISAFCSCIESPSTIFA